MELDQSQFKESMSIGGSGIRIGGIRVKVAKRVGEVSGNCGGKDAAKLSSCAGKWGSGEKSARIPGGKDGEVHSEGGSAGLARVDLFESTVAVGRLGPAYASTGKGGAEVGGARETASSGTGSTWTSHESTSVGRGQGGKGRARSSETSPGHDDEGYYAHSYGQLAIHREMLQVRFFCSISKTAKCCVNFATDLK